MSGTLLHSPAFILRQVLLNQGWATEAGIWPVYVSQEPDTPDNCLTLYDTVGVKHGRSMSSKESVEHHGMQLRVRSSTYDAGYTKIRGMAVNFDDLDTTTVTIDGSTYRIHSVNRVGDVLSIGTETPVSKRRVFTLNVLSAIILT